MTESVIVAGSMLVLHSKYGQMLAPVISTNDSFDTARTSPLMIKVITAVAVFMLTRLHFVAGNDKVKRPRQQKKASRLS